MKIRLYNRIKLQKHQITDSSLQRIDIMKKLLLGNEAVARGLYEHGCRIVSSYPGTPSTEITEFAATYDALYA